MTDRAEVARRVAYKYVEWEREHVEESWGFKYQKLADMLSEIVRDALISSETENETLRSRVEGLEKALERYRAAMDAIYNSGTIGRAIVIEHFGLHHSRAALSAKEES